MLSDGVCVQWREASYTTPGGDVYRVYVVCNVAVTAVDNWLRTPYIDRRHANRLYVDVKFTMRRCTNYPDPVRLQQCKESFKVITTARWRQDAHDKFLIMPNLRATIRGYSIIESGSGFTMNPNPK